MASTFSRGRPSPPRVSLLHISFLRRRVRCRGRLYPPGSGGSGECAAGIGPLFGGSEALGVLPDVGRYAEGTLVYVHQVEARGAAGTESVRDRTGGRDDEAVDSPLDGVNGVQVVMAAEDQLGTEVGEGVEGLLGVGEPVATRELAPYGVVVDHDYTGGVGGGVPEGLPYVLDVCSPDVPDHAEVPEAPGDRTARDAVGRIEARNHHPRHLQGRAQVLGDVPGVSRVLELVCLFPEQAAQVARHGPEPADVVVAGDDDVGSDLLDGVEVFAGLRELLLRAALCEIARDRDRIRVDLDDKLSQGVQPLGGGGSPEVEVREVQHRGHGDGFYPTGPERETRPAQS